MRFFTQISVDNLIISKIKIPSVKCDVEGAFKRRLLLLIKLALVEFMSVNPTSTISRKREKPQFSQPLLNNY